MTSNATPIIEFKGVNKWYASNGYHVLRDVNLQFAKGEKVVICGPSGSGKSTLIRCINALEEYQEGTLTVDGTVLGDDLKGIDQVRREVGMVFQQFNLFPHLTVMENLILSPTWVAKMPRKEAIDKAMVQLERVRIAEHANKYPLQLSGGQQQRVALARALAPAPKVLLLDEPLSALDLKLRKEMQIELKRLQLETGITFIFVTHDQEEALTMSDRIGVMSAGKLQQVGSPKEIYNHPVNRFVASFIGESNFLPATREGDRYRLDCGALIAAPTAKADRVTLTVRPEQVRLAAMGEADAIPATIINLVYFGTDTHCHLSLSDGTEVVARLQSPATGDAGLGLGQAVALRFVPEAIQVLED